jgi:4-amino-4-deoxy-L-arabinose transferase-like glycosyltransferase
MTKIILATILILSIFLRFYQPFTANSSGLTIPPSLNWDEASLGYNAYSILKSGKDEWGRALPLTFEAFGDYKLPGYIYTALPFIAIFGLSEFSVRLPSQIAGVFAVLLVYLISKRIFKDETTALFSAFLIAISPWHLFLSRIALEANLALTFFLAGLYLFLLDHQRLRYLILSSVLFGLTFFTYNSARVFMPLFLISLVVFYKKDLLTNKKLLMIPASILGVFILSAAILAVFQDSSSRYFWVTILDQGAINSINEARNNSNLPDILNRIINNRVVYFIKSFIINYLKHFSLPFLYFEGGSNHQFSIPNQGLAYILELPFLLIGLVSILRKKVGFILLAWLFLAPIPSAITREAPHVLRSIFMLGVMQIITGYGLVTSLKRVENNIVNKTALSFLLLGLFGICSFYYIRAYFSYYPKNESQSWQYGMKQMYEYLDNNSLIRNEEKIYITKRYGEPHIFYLFYSGYDPRKYQNNSTLVRYERTNWRWIDRLDNLFFINDWEIKEKLQNEKNFILVTSPGNYPPDSKVLYSINFLDGSKAFDIVRI